MSVNRSLYQFLNKKEAIWLLVTISLVAIIFLGIHGVDGFKPGTFTNINVYDTYYVFTTYYSIIFISFLIFYAVYLCRMLRRNFKNVTANLIFILSSIGLILIFTFLISIINAIPDITSSNTPTSNNSDQMEHARIFWRKVYYILLSIQFILIILLSISGIKAGLNYKLRE